MAKKRDYANVDTMMEALKKEGLHEVAAIAGEPSGNKARIKPVFLTVDPDLIKRLEAEGFEHRDPEAPKPKTDAELNAELEALAAAPGSLEAGNPAGDNATAPPEQSPGPDDDESGEMAAAGHPGAEDDGGEPPVKPEDGSEDGGDWAEGDAGPAPDLATYRAGLPRLANAGLSDLFFNHDHSAYHRLYSVATAAGTVVNPKDEEAAVKEAAEEFAGMVLNAFGVAVDADELVADFFARL